MSSSPWVIAGELADQDDTSDVDEWLMLFANRDEVADAYATALRLHGPDWQHWREWNEAILRRWSMAGLRYIKTKAWNLASGPKEGEGG